jgi:ribosomal-protein-alanine N-acetyltransferase
MSCAPRSRPFRQRLLLRAVSAGDVDAVFAIHGNAETYRFHPDGVARSREESAAQLAGWQREWREVGFGFWAVSVATDPRVVGFGGLTRRTFRERPVLNTYYRFDPSAWGHGYATEMAAAAAALARRLLPELPMIIRTRPANLAAQAVAGKIGLVRAVDLDEHLLSYVSHWNGPRPARAPISRPASAATTVLGSRVHTPGSSPTRASTIDCWFTSWSSESGSATAGPECPPAPGRA